MNKVCKMLLEGSEVDRKVAKQLLRIKRFRPLARDIGIIAVYCELRHPLHTYPRFRKFKGNLGIAHELKAISTELYNDVYTIRRQHGYGGIKRPTGLYYKKADEALKRIKSDKY